MYLTPDPLIVDMYESGYVLLEVGNKLIRTLKTLKILPTHVHLPVFQHDFGIWSSKLHIITIGNIWGVHPQFFYIYPYDPLFLVRYRDIRQSLLVAERAGCTKCLSCVMDTRFFSTTDQVGEGSSKKRTHELGTFLLLIKQEARAWGSWGPKLWIG